MQETSSSTINQKEKALNLYQSCCQSEDTERQEQAYMELFQMVLRAAYNRYGNDMALSEEIAQQTLFFVHTKIQDCQKPEAFISFVMWQMRDAAKRILNRTKGPAGEKLYSWDAFIEADENPDLQKEDSSTEEPEKKYVQQELQGALHNALERLADERLQKVVYWRYIDGLSDKEIAQRLEINDGYVRRLRSSAMKRLKDDKELRGFFSGEGL